MPAHASNTTTRPRAYAFEYNGQTAFVVDSQFRDLFSPEDFAALAKDGGYKWVELAPYGMWKGHPNGPFKVTREIAAKMVENSKRRSDEIVVDYEHQTLQGEKAPASGWIKELDARETGLWGLVRWTEVARGHISKDEYRYLSPVFFWDWVDEKTGEKIGPVLHSVAITNVPFLDGQTALQLTRQVPGGQPGLDNPKEDQMDAKLFLAICKALGLPEDAKPEDVSNKVTELTKGLKEAQAELTKLKEAQPKDDGGKVDAAILKALELPEDAKPEDVVKKLAELKAAPVDRDKVIEGLSAEVQALKAKDVAREKATIEAEVNALVKDLKITPAQKETALKLFGLNPELARQHYATACKVVPTGPVMDEGGHPVKQSDPLEKDVQSQLRLTDEEWEKFAGDE